MELIRELLAAAPTRTNVTESATVWQGRFDILEDMVRRIMIMTQKDGTFSTSTQKAGGDPAIVREMNELAKKLEELLGDLDMSVKIQRDADLARGAGA